MNPVERNIQIQAFIERKDAAGETYSLADKDFIASYEGAGGLARKGASGQGLLHEFYTLPPPPAIEGVYIDGDLIQSSTLWAACWSADSCLLTRPGLVPSGSPLLAVRSAAAAATS